MGLAEKEGRLSTVRPDLEVGGKGRPHPRHRDSTVIDAEAPGTVLACGNCRKAGMVWINSYKLVDPASPFGGYKMSGLGREMGFEAMREYTQVKSVWVGYDFKPWSWPE